MQQRERQTCAFDRRRAATLAEIADEVSNSIDLVEVADMAATSLDNHERDALRALLEVISDKLEIISNDLLAHLERPRVDAA